MSKIKNKKITGDHKPIGRIEKPVYMPFFSVLNFWHRDDAIINLKKRVEITQKVVYNGFKW